ncbi:MULTISPECIES: DUF6215 domain-containing protein [unclassified Streptomyces]|uniref:DUF6215 domain-containing protein n=1 Tax=unclassified Streptomyces TaxID=2593676 RepID=UPI002E822282|nr:DUF6215 domain-containing protein [Streptomyces sp. NBC_00589]WTI35784.1 DUF6215 domain-containing protein [Streptomyces sp. NBC_00775]WUB30542.1 DUF6215 domain-containing protein [Streptomyces sp. NBC_00589]
MVGDLGESKKGMSAGAQAVAAVVMVGGLAGVLWGLQEASSHNADDDRPAACSGGHDARSSKYVSGAQLCAALNRPDLPALLGTPDEHAETAGGSKSSVTLADGTKIAAPEANVDLMTYSVKLSASYDHLPVADTIGYLGESAEKKTVLGHPAVLYSDRTIAITFNLGGGKADSGPGGSARRLLVAGNAKDGGGSFEIDIWRQDDVPPDDAALFRVAEKVLPTIPGWTAG